MGVDPVTAAVPVSRARVVVAVLALVSIGAVVALIVLAPRTATSRSDPASVHEHVDAATSQSGQPAGGDVPLDPEAAEHSTIGGSDETGLADAASDPSPSGRDPAAVPAPRSAVGPEDVLAGSADTLGGCHPAYGEDGQCLPEVPPSLAQHLQDMLGAGLDPSTMPHPWQCGEAREYFPNGIRVRVPDLDPLELDRNGDGTACGPED